MCGNIFPNFPSFNDPNSKVKAWFSCCQRDLAAQEGQ
jgi:hypothetical protein